MTTWLVVVAAAVATYLIRISMVVVYNRRSLPAGFERMLSLAAPAVLAAVAANSLFVGDGSIHAPEVAALFAVAAAAVAVWRTGKPVHALVVGLPLALVVMALARA